MKKLWLFSLIFILAAATADAATLFRVRLGNYPDKIRVVLDFDAKFAYTLEESKEKLIIHLLKTSASSDIQNYVEMGDYLIRYLEFEREDAGIKLTVPLTEPITYKIGILSAPDRLVIDFNRSFTNLVSGGTVIDGVEALMVSKGSEQGRINANVLKIDLKKAEVCPALAKKSQDNPIESFFSFFNPWKGGEPNKHFLRARVSRIGSDQDAVAAINGTYFAYTGKPLGTLLIDKELISSPIFDRTALILTDANHPIIDNILIDSFFLSPNGVRYDITGVNQGRGESSIVLYTPVWGKKTGTNTGGIELVVSNSAVKSFLLGNSDIPPDGYVLSISGPAAQFVRDNLKLGDKINLHIKIIPYNSATQSILHMLSGGPRLVKNGMIYVSKHEEKFRPDVAISRAARTAVGVTADKKLLLVTVDGLPRKKSARNEKSSIGITLEELASLMIDLGATDAMNLDGGSSTTMWINGRVVNIPVGGDEAPVSNALVVRGRNSD